MIGPVDRSMAREGLAWPEGAMVAVTGASSGLGRELAQQLLAQGSRVYALVHPRHRGRADLPASQVVWCDLSDPAQTDAAAAELAEAVPELDSLVLCAASAAYGSIADVPWPMAHQVMTVNYLANAILLQRLLPTLRSRPRARVIAVGSGSALIGMRRSAAYGAAKAAFQNLIESLAAECEGTPVEVLHVVPGYMATPLHEKQPTFPEGQRVPPTGRPQDVRSAARAILHRAARHGGTQVLGAGPRIGYHLRYWWPAGLRAALRRAGY
jgi:NAD(P)-dependent dehydrogenase (short-subunit alcohol dehydrogenase family)